MSFIQLVWWSSGELYFTAALNTAGAVKSKPEDKRLPALRDFWKSKWVMISFRHRKEGWILKNHNNNIDMIINTFELF